MLMISCVLYIKAYFWFLIEALFTASSGSLCNEVELYQHIMYTVSAKKETKMFSVISPSKLGQLWWNLAYSFLNKFATTQCKRFPPHLNNVSTLPCETWNAHRVRATIALLDRDTPEFIPPQLWSPNSPDLNPFDNSMWKMLQGVQNMHHWSGAIDDDADGWLPQWRRDSACSTPFSVAVSVHLDQWCVFLTSSLAIFPTLCNQLDSNLANLEATVAVW